MMGICELFMSLRRLSDVERQCVGSPGPLENEDAVEVVGRLMDGVVEW